MTASRIGRILLGVFLILGSLACVRGRRLRGFTEPSQTAATVSRRATRPPLVCGFLPPPRDVEPRRHGGHRRVRKTGDHVPVPSLEPANTARRSGVVSSRPMPAKPAPAPDCRPLRAVFYAASDWLRLATKLAAVASPCAEYYVSVPPVVADKTTFPLRPALAHPGPRLELPRAGGDPLCHLDPLGGEHRLDLARGRRDGPASGWPPPVSTSPSVTPGRSTSSPRQFAAGTATPDVNVREFLRGLYEGDGTPAVRGAAFVIGFGQRDRGRLRLPDDTLQSWFADTASGPTWRRTSATGRRRCTATCGATPFPALRRPRREYLNDYLQHKLVARRRGPADDRAGARLPPGCVQPARERGLAAGGRVGLDDGARSSRWRTYVSAQIDAMRSFSLSSGQARDHCGFAWAPRNTTGLSNADFAAQTGQILDRLAAAIRDSGVADPESPDSGACGAGQTLCAVDLPEASHNGAWRLFRAWARSTLSIGPVAPIRVVAGVASAPLELSVPSAVARPSP